MGQYKGYLATVAVEGKLATYGCDLAKTNVKVSLGRRREAALKTRLQNRQERRGNTNLWTETFIGALLRDLPVKVESRVTTILRRTYTE